MPFQVCPICATRVGMDLIGHLTMQHGSYFKISFFYCPAAVHMHVYIFTLSYTVFQKALLGARLSALMR